MNEVPFKPVSEWAGEDAKLAELKQSDKIEDQLTALLMEPHTENEVDETGLWYTFANQKARAIMRRYDITPKNQSSSLPEGKV